MNSASLGFRSWLSVIVVFFAAAAAFQIVRAAAAFEFLTERPESAARAWLDHPKVNIALAMNEIGKAASRGRPAPTRGIDLAMAAAGRGPLLIEPFLIKGAEAISEGQFETGERLFSEARRRDPRSAAARFFLAQHYLATGRPLPGLAEASALARLIPGGNTVLVPGLAQYAQTPGAVTILLDMFAANPSLAALVLVELARDPSNADLILALAPDNLSTGKGVAPGWHAQLLNSLVAAEKFQDAYSLWRRISGVPGEPKGLFNPRFAPSAAPAPFNWTLGSGQFGVAESTEDGSLRVLYSGRRHGQFASQLLLLEPGTYHLRMTVRREGSPEEKSGLGWSLKCLNGNKKLLALPLPEPSSLPRALSAEFSVTRNCGAQLLHLSGIAREFAASEQVVISDLRLTGGPQS